MVNEHQVTGESASNGMSTFKEYGRGLKPHDQTVTALLQVMEKERALELGPASSLRDTVLIAPAFKTVDLVDQQQSVGEALKSLSTDLREKITFYNTTFSTFRFEPNSYDFISAVDALPFTGRDFDTVFQDIVTALKPEGIFSCSIWTPKHGWNIEQAKDLLAFREENQIRTLLANFEIIQMEKFEREGPAGGDANIHWDSYRIIARKKKDNSNAYVRVRGI